MDNGFKIQPEKLEANNYSGTEGQVLGKEEPIAQSLPEAKDNLSFDGLSNVLVTGSIQSKNFRSGVQGWKLGSDGTAEFN